MPGRACFAQQQSSRHPLHSFAFSPAGYAAINPFVLHRPHPVSSTGFLRVVLTLTDTVVSRHFRIFSGRQVLGNLAGLFQRVAQLRVVAMPELGKDNTHAVVCIEHEPIRQ